MHREDSALRVAMWEQNTRWQPGVFLGMQAEPAGEMGLNWVRTNKTTASSSQQRV